MGAFFRLVMFFAYLVLVVTLPLTLLLGVGGLVIGVSSSLALILMMGWGANERIVGSLKAKPLLRAQHPDLHHLLDEIARCLHLSKPKLYVIEQKALNLAHWGFFKNTSSIGITRGLLERLKRDELIALLTNQMVQIKRGRGYLQNWLASFFQILEPWLIPWEGDSSEPRSISLSLVLRQIFLYPLALPALYLLLGKQTCQKWDRETSQLTQNPRALAEAFRIVESVRGRFHLEIPYSTCHLFLLPPLGNDPFLRSFYDSFDMNGRIGGLEKQIKVQAQS